MEKLNKRVSIIFAILVAVFIGLAVGGCPIEPLNHQEYVIFESGNDFMADFFNIQRFLVDGDPYFNELNGIYFPLAYLLLMPFTPLCDYANMSLEDCWNTNFAVFSALFFLLLSLFLFFDSLYRLNNKKGWRTFNTILLLFTSIFLFSTERGNEIFIAAAGVNYFLAYYDTEDRWKRWFGLFCLCFAAVLKVYPVLFGILLLQDKRYKDIAFCIVTGLLLTFVPFLFFKHGLANVPRMIENYYTYTALYLTPSTEYKFGIHALGNGILFAVNYLNPGTIADSVVRGMAVTTKILTALLTLVSLILAFLEKRRWLQIGLIAMVIMMYPSHSIFYCGLYLIPMMMLFLSKEECTKTDYVIGILLCLIMNPIQIVVPPITLTPILANIFTIVLWILFIVYSGRGVLNKQQA